MSIWNNNNLFFKNRHFKSQKLFPVFVNDRFKSTKKLFGRFKNLQFFKVLKLERKKWQVLGR